MRGLCAAGDQWWLMPRCAGAGGVWGVSSRARFSAKSSGTVSDEDLQAQAWLPSCLRSLLAEVRPLALHYTI